MCEYSFLGNITCFSFSYDKGFHLYKKVLPSSVYNVNSVVKS